MNFNFFKTKEFLFFCLIMMVAVFFRFFRLTVFDLISDDALYSLRAFAWFDYLGGGQTTPIQWFGDLPGWSKWSFHDAPPLVFAIQNLFFKLFGPTTLAARLPFALAGSGAVAAVYFAAKKIRGLSAAVSSSAIAAVSALAVWISRAGYLEGVEVLFIALAVLSFIFFIAAGRPKHLYGFFIFTGLSIMSKYTAIFLLPAILVYLAIFKRKLFSRQEFWLGAVLFLLVLSPVIVYNLKVFQARGHFDAALSSMVGMHPQDFSGISERGVNFNLQDNFVSICSSLFDTTSLPLLIAFVAGLLYLFIKISRRRANKGEIFVALNLGFALLMFLFSGTGPRFFSIIMPLFALIFGFLAADIWDLVKAKKIAMYIALTAFIFLVAVEGAYSANTNLTVTPAGSSPLFYSYVHLSSRGFNELDEFISQKVFADRPAKMKIDSLDDLSFDLQSYAGQEVVLLDGTINWFASFWYFDKYALVYRLPIFDFSNLLMITPSGTNPIKFLQDSGVAGFYYIFAVDDSVFDSVKKSDTALRSNMELLSKDLERVGVPVSRTIKNRSGETIFKIYHYKFK